jgi:hypothetical protein
MWFSFGPTGHSARVVRLAWLGVVLVMAGCANETGEHDASAAAARFLAATGGGDTRAACALLAPAVRDDLAASEGESCEDALPADRLRGVVTGVEVWAEWSRVRTDGGAVFLTEFDDGWLITAAGCQPHGEAPYRCVVGD